ncbi:SusC/RagA family TonB-linked outer membrane protein [Maribacter sp. 2307ULW6-5]|uniref:SusC/RagA family TonB-linked outer membrane protein n=1 Tax=Maribacter sp. 2307ULW6-5 TaxID=3386275 RepID=UPI0039BD8742
MNLTDDYNSVRSKGAWRTFGIGILSLVFCLGTQLVRANAGTSLNEPREMGLQSTITGTVLDENGAPLPGASVVIKGTTTGTQTDFDGNFSIEANADDTLIFSYVGYASQEIAIDGQTSLSISMAVDAAALDEVVVVGYAAQTRGDLTGSVSSVDVSEAVKQPLVNVAEALEGRATGVSITNAGAPGGTPIVRIRGFGTPNNNNPLYIIDGLQTQDGSILNNINPADIDQINVLKDGAASIYGARASNGVIIVTTKNGNYNQNKLSVSVEAYTGFSQVTNLPDMLNAEQLGDVIYVSKLNDAIRTGAPIADIRHPQYFPNGGNPVVPSQLVGVTLQGTGEAVDAPVRPGGTNWLEEIFRMAPTQNFSATVSNGGERGKYSFSAGYLNREGIQLNTGFKRGQVRFNSEYKVTDRLTVGENVNISFGNTRLAGNNTSMAMRISPLVPVRDSQGRFAGTYNNARGLSNAENPVANLARNSDDFSKQTRILGDIYANLELADGLNVRTVLGGDINIINQRDFLARDPESAEPRATNSLRERNAQFYNWVWTNTLNYVKTFGKHNINALVGLEATRGTGKSLEVSATGFLFETPDFYLLDNASGSPIVNPGETYDFENTLSSVFGSANYSYNNKYLVTATLRRDRSSRFLGDKQTGIFPAFSAGWNISNEGFFPQDGFVNRLKLKASWGAMGNQELPASNPTRNISSLNNQLADYAFTGSGSAATGALLSQVGNPNLGWETTESFNVGTEIGLLNNTLNFSLEYYRITTQDLIAQDLTIISDTAIDANPPFTNIGSFQNTGFDFTASYFNQTSDDFSFGADLNLSTVRNEVLELASEFQLGNRFRSGVFNRTQVGQPLASFFGLENNGIYRSEAEVAAGPDQGFPNDGAGVGRLRFVDQNGDGVINDDDRTFIGSPHPDVILGLNLSANYKNWDISLFFSGTIGNDIYNFERIYTDFGTFPDGNRNVRVLDAFHPVTNPSGSAPALSFGVLNGETSPNSFFVEDGSFVRLKNLSIGYTFPNILTDNWGIDNLRLYVNANNLLTITGYNGLDPEIRPASDTSALTLGVDDNTFPLARIFTFGVNLKL